MGALKLRVEDDADGLLRVSLFGVIDETVDVQGVLGALDRGPVVLDLAGIERINSVGVQRWSRAMAEVTSRQPVRIDACSYPMSFQANVVSNFFGAAEVWSCLAPYFCPTCNQEMSMLVTVAEVEAAEGEVPEKVCPDCGTQAEFDELEGFFQFMREARVLD